MIKNSIKYISIILKKKEKFHLKLFFFGLVILSILEALSVGLIPTYFTIILDKNLLLEKFKFNNEIYSYIKILLDNENIIFYFTFIILIFFLIKFLYNIIFIIYEAKFFNNLKIRVSSSLFKIYLNKNYLFHSSNNPLILGRNISSEVNIAASYIRSSIIIIKEFLQIFLIGILLVFANFKITILIFVFFTLCSLIYLKIFSSKLREKSKISFFERGEKSKIIHQILNSIIEVKLYSKSDYFVNKFTNSIKREFQSTILMDIISKLPKTSIEFLVVAVVCFSIAFALMLNFELISIIPIVALYFFAALRIYPSINTILHNRMMLINSKVSINNVSDQIITADKDIDVSNGNENNISFKNSVKLENISFKYNNRIPTFENINLEINKFDTVGILGETGSGKSTLIKIIMGLLEPSAGSIMVDNLDLKKNKKSWQKKIGYVPQNFYIFDDTIYENIIFGGKKDDDSIDKIKNILKETSLENFINSLPDKLNTLVGPNAKQISGGQAQRLAIARALYQDTDLIIFDEATSSLDINTEAEIIKNIYSLRNKKTLIVITHKENLLKDCNKIFKIKDRKIVKILG